MLATISCSVNRHNAVGKPLLPLPNAAFPYGYRDLPLHKASCRTFCMSKGTGRYILFGSGANIYLSNDWGRTFSVKEGAVSAGTSAYQSLISDDGNVIVLYGLATGNTFQLSTDGLNTGLTTISSLGTSTTFTVLSVAISDSGQYVFVSGNGADGGLFASSDFGASFSKPVSSTAAQSCSCSPSGALVVLSMNNAAPQFSVNYGSTFSAKGTTTYAGRKVYIHPDETFFAMRTDTSIVYVDLSVPNSTKINSSSATFELQVASTTSPVVLNTQVNSDFTATIDRNGRFYYISSGADGGSNANRLCYGRAENGLSAETLVPNFSDSNNTFTNYKIFGTHDGKYLLAFTGTTLRLFKQFHESASGPSLNTFSPAILTDGTFTFNYSDTSASSLSLSWTPTTSTAQPVVLASGSNRDVNPISNFIRNIAYSFTLSSLSASGVSTNRITFAPTNNSTKSDPTRVLKQATSVSLSTPSNWSNKGGNYIACSSNGQSVAVALGATVYYSSDRGETWSELYNFITNADTSTSDLNLYWIWMSSNGSKIFVSSTGVPLNRFIRTIDSGSSWNVTADFYVNNAGRWTTGITVSSDDTYVVLSGGGNNGARNRISLDGGLIFSEATVEYFCMDSCISGNYAYFIDKQRRILRQTISPFSSSPTLITLTNYFTSNFGARARIQLKSNILYVYDGNTAIKKSSSIATVPSSLSFTNCTYPAGTSTLTCFMFDNSGTLFAASNNKLYRSTDNAVTWTSFDTYPTNIVCATVFADGKGAYLLDHSSTTAKLYTHIF